MPNRVPQAQKNRLMVETLKRFWSEATKTKDNVLAISPAAQLVLGSSGRLLP